MAVTLLRKKIFWCFKKENVGKHDGEVSWSTLHQRDPGLQYDAVLYFVISVTSNLTFMALKKTLLNQLEVMCRDQSPNLVTS